MEPADRERAETRRRLQDLVDEAEQLVELARLEAERIVEAARVETAEKAGRLVAQAEELRSAAEAEAAEIRRQAEEERIAAREHADEVLADANRTSAEILARAREVDDGDGDEPISADAARQEADRILRIARAEAEARSAEMIEEARRKVESVEAEGRARLEELRQTHRALQRRMRDEEVEVLARIQEHEERLGILEQKPTPEGVELPEVVDGGSGKVDAPPVAAPERRPVVERPRDADRPAAYPWSIRERMEGDAEDPDVLKALRAIKRRA